MGTYYQSNTPLAIGAYAFPQEMSLLTTTSAGVSLTGSVAAAASAAGTHVFTGPSGAPGVGSWPTTTSDIYAAQFDVTAATSLTYYLALSRISADASTVVKGFQATGSPTTGTGLKLISTNGGVFNPNTAGTVATDRFAVRVLADNGDMMAANNLTLQVNTANSYVTVPWTVGGGGGAQGRSKTSAGVAKAVKNSAGVAKPLKVMTASGLKTLP